MFSLFKPDPTKKLKQNHARLLEKAMQAQRRGDIRSYSELTAQAEEIDSKIQQLEKSNRGI